MDLSSSQYFIPSFIDASHGRGVPLALSAFSSRHCKAIEFARNLDAGELLVAPQGNDCSANIFLLWMGLELACKHLESEWGSGGSVVIRPGGVANSAPHLDA
jgi:hypothetical protein